MARYYQGPYWVHGDDDERWASEDKRIGWTDDDTRRVARAGDHAWYWSDQQRRHVAVDDGLTTTDDLAARLAAGTGGHQLAARFWVEAAELLSETARADLHAVYAEVGVNERRWEDLTPTERDRVRAAEHRADAWGEASHRAGTIAHYGSEEAAQAAAEDAEAAEGRELDEAQRIYQVLFDGDYYATIVGDGQAEDSYINNIWADAHTHAAMGHTAAGLRAQRSADGGDGAAKRTHAESVAELDALRHDGDGSGGLTMPHSQVRTHPAALTRDQIAARLAELIADAAGKNDDGYTRTPQEQLAGQLMADAQDRGDPPPPAGWNRWAHAQVEQANDDLRDAVTDPADAPTKELPVAAVTYREHVIEGYGNDGNPDDDRHLSPSEVAARDLRLERSSVDVAAGLTAAQLRGEPVDTPTPPARTDTELAAAVEASRAHWYARAADLGVIDRPSTYPAQGSYPAGGTFDPRVWWAARASDPDPAVSALGSAVVDAMDESPRDRRLAPYPDDFYGTTQTPAGEDLDDALDQARAQLTAGDVGEVDRAAHEARIEVLEAELASDGETAGQTTDRESLTDDEQPALAHIRGRTTMGSFATGLHDWSDKRWADTVEGLTTAGYPVEQVHGTVADDPSVTRGWVLRDAGGDGGAVDPPERDPDHPQATLTNDTSIPDELAHNGDPALAAKTAAGMAAEAAATGQWLDAERARRDAATTSNDTGPYAGRFDHGESPGKTSAADAVAAAHQAVTAGTQRAAKEPVQPEQACRIGSPVTETVERAPAMDVEAS